jgi:xanthine dehydrogenase large subunit
MAESAIRGGVAEAVPHDSAAKHVAGAALYVDDLPEPAGMLYAAVGLSAKARAAIVRMDLESVRTAPGVVAVVTAQDIPGVNDVGPVYPGDPLLADRMVEYAGQALFAVAADTVEQARRAARLAEVEYRELEPTLTVDDALAQQSFVLPPHEMRRGDPDAALADAPHRLAGRIRMGGQDHFYLEGQVAFAVPGEDGDMLVWSSTQHPSEVQHLIANILDRPHHAITVEVRRMGGGFGGKETQAAPFACLAALLAHHARRPVKLRLDRDDDMLLTGKRHGFLIDYDVGFDQEGRIQGVTFEQAADCGFSPDLSAAIADRAMFHADNAYYLPHVRINSHRCKTHTVSNTAFRGFGGPQGMMGIEKAIDAIARELGLDPLEVRRRNLYGGAGRDLTPYHMRVEDNVLPELINELADTSEYRRRRQEIATFNAASPVLRRGLALTPVKFGISFTVTHLNQAGALLHVYTDGSVHLNHGGTEMGQGLMTKVAQLVAEEFQIDLDRVRISATSTGKVPNTSATAASAGTDLNGGAALAAARTIKGRLIEFLAEHFKLAPEQITFRQNAVRIGEQSMSFGDLARLAHFHRVQLSATGFYRTLRPRPRARPAVLLLRLWRRRVRGRGRHADRRVPPATRGSAARRRPLDQPGDRHGPDRRRLRPGHGLADHRGAVLERARRTHHPRALHVQDPDRGGRAGRLPGAHLGEGDQLRAGGRALEGGRRAAADARHLGVPRDQRCHRQSGRRPAQPGAGRAGHAGARAVRDRGHEAPRGRDRVRRGASGGVIQPHEVAAGIRRLDPALLHLDDRLDLDRYPVRQAADADRGAGMLLAEHLDEEVRAAVHHRRVVGELGHGVDHPEQLDDSSNSIEVAQLLLEHREQLQPDETGVRRRLFGRDVGADLALWRLAVGRHRHVARKKQQVPGAHGVRVVGGRRPHRRQPEPEFPDTLLDRHGLALLTLRSGPIPCITMA